MTSYIKDLQNELENLEIKAAVKINENIYKRMYEIRSILELYNNTVVINKKIEFKTNKDRIIELENLFDNSNKLGSEAEHHLLYESIESKEFTFLENKLKDNFIEFKEEEKKSV